MTLSLFMAFLAVITTLLLAPGPSVWLAIHNGLIHGVRAAVIGILGNVVAFQGLMALSAMSLSAVIQIATPGLLIMKYAGGAYLGYLGLRLLIAPAGTISRGAGEGSDPTRVWRLFRQAFLVTVSNPKALMFVVALLPQFVDPDHAVLPQWGLMAMTTVIVHFCVYWGYAVAGHKASRYLLDARIRRFYNGASGVLFLGFAVGWMFGSW
jgi:homoserine/homoserine lactone efflux protein